MPEWFNGESVQDRVGADTGNTGLAKGSNPLVVSDQRQARTLSNAVLPICGLFLISTDVEASRLNMS